MYDYEFITKRVLQDRHNKIEEEIEKKYKNKTRAGYLLNTELYNKKGEVCIVGSLSLEKDMKLMHDLLFLMGIRSHYPTDLAYLTEDYHFDCLTSMKENGAIRDIINNQYCCSYIENSDALIVFTDEINRIGETTQKEIRYATDNRIPVYYVNKLNPDYHVALIEGIITDTNISERSNDIIRDAMLIKQDTVILAGLSLYYGGKL